MSNLVSPLLRHIPAGRVERAGAARPLPSTLASWGALCLAPPEQEPHVEGPCGASTFLSDLATCMAEVGVAIAPPPLVLAAPGASVLQHAQRACASAWQRFGKE